MSSHEHCCSSGMFWVYIGFSLVLVVFAGIMSGLTLGLMSLELVDLEILMKSGSPQDRKHAHKIYPVVKDQHLLLCTLLICNALAMEALPIFLDAVVNAWGAILISVTLILLFGEILPQAVCSRYGLAIGATMTPVVRVLVWICFPISFPISKLLDAVLGKDHVALFRRAELKTLVGMHDKDAGKGGELSHDEATIITGALELTEKAAVDAMTPIAKAFTIDINAKLDVEMMKSILKRGHSRVPVYFERPTNIVGLLLVKALIRVRPEDDVLIRDLEIRKIPRVMESIPLYDILNEFQEGHSHMAVVVRHNQKKSESMKKKPSLDRRLSSRRFNLKNSSPQIVTIIDMPPTLTTTGTSATAAAAAAAAAVSVVTNKNNCDSNSNTNKDGEVDQNQRRQKLSEDILDVSTLRSFNDDEAVGIITMEDVIEELLQEEIWDESDQQREIYDKLLFSPRGGMPVSVSETITPRTSTLTASSSNSPPPPLSPSTSSQRCPTA